MQQTSLQAYHLEIRPTLGERQKAVLQALRSRETFTNTELAEYLNWPINTLTPRVKELRDKKLVCMACVRECKVTGRRVIAWKLSDSNTNLSLF